MNRYTRNELREEVLGNYGLLLAQDSGRVFMFHGLTSETRLPQGEEENPYDCLDQKLRESCVIIEQAKNLRKSGYKVIAVYDGLGDISWRLFEYSTQFGDKKTRNEELISKIEKAVLKSG